MNVDSANAITEGLTRRHLMERGALGAAGLALGPALLAACGGSDEDSLDVRTITWAQVEGPPDLDPLRRYDLQGAAVLALALESLLKFDFDYQLVPSLASDFEQTSATELRFQLRSGVEFTNGKPLTVDDVVYSLTEVMTNKRSAMGFIYGNVAAIEARGATDIVISLKEPDIIFKYYMAHTAGLIQSKDVAEEFGDNLGTPGQLPVGTGPYEILEYTQGDQVTLRRVDSYWGDAPAPEDITVRVIPEASSRLLALRSGDTAGTFDVPPEQLAEWRDVGQVGQGKELVPAYLIFNVTKAPWDDIHVRRAFAHAIDRQGLVESAVGGAAEVANGFAPPAYWAPLGLSNEEVIERYAGFPQYEFDLDRARSELAQSKHADGFAVDTVYDSRDERLGELLLHVKENMAPLGVDVSVRKVTLDQWIARLFSEDQSALGLEVLILSPDYVDPTYMADVFLESQIGGGVNQSGFVSSEVERLYAQQRGETDNAKRIDLLMRIMEIVAEQVPVTPVWWEGGLTAHNRSIEVEPTALYYVQNWASTIRSAG